MIYILSDTPIEGAVRLPVIKQRFFTPQIHFCNYDYLIFTSKNGVKAAQKISEDWKKVPSLAIGEATAKEIEKCGGTVAFVAKEYYGDAMAKELKKRFSAKKRYLYLRPKAVSSNLMQILKEAGFLVDEAIVYETICVPCKELRAPPKGSVIIFSSPSTVRCFLKCFGWDECYRAIAIGKKTAKAFGKPIQIAPKPTLKSAVEFARKLGFWV